MSKTNGCILTMIMQRTCKIKGRNIPVKKALKEKGVRFQTPLTRMRVFFETGSVMYNSVTQAAEDLRKRGFSMGEVTRGSKGISEETLTRLLPWEVIVTQRGGDKEQVQWQIREKLREYRRTAAGDE